MSLIYHLIGGKYNSFEGGEIGSACQDQVPAITLLREWDSTQHPAADGKQGTKHLCYFYFSLILQS